MMKKHCRLALLSFLLFSMTAAAQWKTPVRNAGDDGVAAYRIPGLVTTPKGTLIAVYDVRYANSYDLQADIDVGMSRSTDGGRTWEPMRLVLDMGEWGGRPQAENGVGDPSVLADPNTGRIYVLGTWTHGIPGQRAWTAVGQGMEPGETAQLMLSFFDENTRRLIHQRIIDEGVTDPNEKVVYLRARVIGLLESECVRVFCDHEDEILSGTFEGSLISHISPMAQEAYHQCSQLSVERIYRSKPVLDVELSGYQIIQTLMEQFIEAAVHPDRFYSRQLIGRVSSQYHISAPDLETRLMAVIDYISGMTDVYALDEYQKISGISLPVV